MTPAQLHRRALDVLAEGGDPDRLVRTLAWVTTPRRSADALRRAVRDRAPQLGERAPLDPSGPAAFDAALVEGDVRVGPAVLDAIEGWTRGGVRVATAVDPGYPRRLGRAWPHLDVPALVAWRGEVPSVDADPGPAVAMVGARRATGYGTGVAAWLAGAAAAAGVQVVSGGARGVDAAAHGAALDHRGGTAVVLGCGHATAYPRDHARPGGLFDRILASGGTLWSEHLPEAGAHPGNVRARNRIVAALVDAVVVVEGGARSGSLLTASAAAEHDVPVLAVPGDVRAPGSVAPHRLLAEGAAPCTSPDDLLALLGRAGEGDARSPAGAPPPSVLPDAVRTVLGAAWPRPVRVEDLADRAGRPVPVLLGLLTRARVAGEVAQDTDGVRLRRAPASQSAP